MERPLYHYEYVPHRFEDVMELLEQRPGAVLQPATRMAAQRAQEVVRTLHVPLGRFEVGRDVRVRIGDIEARDDRSASLPLSWQAEQGAAVFPSVDAELEIAALADTPPSTQVSLVGTYSPPFGVAGGAADDILGHRVAEATVHRLVEEIVKRIGEELAA